MGKIIASWLAAAAGFSMNAGAITADAPEFRNLADGVFAYIRKRNDANAMVIVTSEGVVLVDTGNSNSDSRALLNDVRSMPNEPVRHVASSKSRRSCGRHALSSPPGHVIPAGPRREILGRQAYIAL